jgi:hypothetical protein
MVKRVPSRGMDVVVMKAAQADASTWAILATLWLLVTRRCQLAYYLPTKDHADGRLGGTVHQACAKNPPSTSSSARAGSRGGLAR